MIRLALSVVLSLIFIAPVAADDIKDLDAKWTKAMKDGDIAGLLALYDEDAVFYAVDAAAVKGSKAIGQYYAEFLAKFRVKDVRMSDTTSEAEDDLAVSWGRFSIVVEPRGGGAEQRLEGRFTGVARKKNGTWRYVADHASAVLTPPAPKAPVE